MYKRQRLVPIGVAGPRLDGSDISSKNITWLSDIIIPYLDSKYERGNYYLVTLSGDKGMGADLKTFCMHNEIRCISIETFLYSTPKKDDSGVPIVDSVTRKSLKEEFGPFADMSPIFISRHAAIFELSVEIFIKMPPPPTFSILQDLVDRFKKSEKPYFIYDLDNNAIEYRGDPESLHG